MTMLKYRDIYNMVKTADVQPPAAIASTSISKTPRKSLKNILFSGGLKGFCISKPSKSYDFVLDVRRFVGSIPGYKGLYKVTSSDLLMRKNRIADMAAALKAGSRSRLTLRTIALIPSPVLLFISAPIK